ETAALPRLRVELDVAAQSDGELVRDREAEPGPGVVPRPERTEDPVALLDGHARAIVVDRDGDAAVRGRQLEADAAAVRWPAEGVREQVGDDLEHAVAVGDDRRARGEVLDVRDPAAPGLLPVCRVGALTEAAHVHLFL